MVKEKTTWISQQNTHTKCVAYKTALYHEEPQKLNVTAEWQIPKKD